MPRILIANRGEIAIRLIDAAHGLGFETVSVAPKDDEKSPHASRATERIELPGAGPAAYLDIDAVCAAVKEANVDGVHPGYGFLSENAEFARRLTASGVTFIGPSSEALEIFGNKATARELAAANSIPMLAATDGPITASEARAFLEHLGPDGAMMLKAVAGGGGRGMAPVTASSDIAKVFKRCSSEATAAFGEGALYAEQLLRDARHVEMQVVADAQGNTVVLGSRDCSTQRRRQKIIEIAPAIWTSPDLLGRMKEDARRLVSSTCYSGLATVEFLVSEDRYYFLEVNPRLQVEHTVTEAVTGVDLVDASIRIGFGSSLVDLGLSCPPPENGVAIQARVNAETLSADGTVVPSGGFLQQFQPPLGAHVRVDTYARVGVPVSARYDSLLAKVIVTGDDFTAANQRLGRALTDLSVEGTRTNRSLLHRLSGSEDFRAGRISTSFVDDNLPRLLADDAGPDGSPLLEEEARDAERSRLHGNVELPDDAFGPPLHLSGVVVQINVREGDVVTAGTELLIVEAMKMQHAVVADQGGRVTAIVAEVGEFLETGNVAVWLTPEDLAESDEQATPETDLDEIRADLAQAIELHQYGLDEGRHDVVAGWHAKGRRTARENIDSLVDPGTFVEYGALAIAAQRGRRSERDLIENTPADGIVLGTAQVHGTPIAVFAYDYTVLAGTQGYANHRKMDRLFRVAEKLSLPIVIFAEGGGGRPGDTDKPAGPGLISDTFLLVSSMAGRVPIIGVVAGYSFAGNAALLGACDVVIATKDSSIGMGGPAMIEGGGLGVHHPADVGPINVQYANGVVDIVADDEHHAVAACKKVLGLLSNQHCPATAPVDQRLLRHLVPENRLRSYNMRPVIETVVDPDSLIELRQGFGQGIITSLARIGGQVVGILANNPHHLGGAIDAPGSDKAERFLTMCEARGLPVISFCDTPGFMVGPDSEREATVRRFGAMFVAGARLTTPLIMIVTRKGYGLGAMAMAGGNMHAPVLTISWPTGEFGGMGLEGAVRLGYRKELDAIEDPQKRKQRYDELLAEMYDAGKAVRMAAAYEIDDVIDPADTRTLILQTLKVARC
ncbi:acetyl-CoA carboxylase family protein [Cumulibacter manganitolerans]|uniref:acetyl-CoA carboxylase family protein n=1 Tax=Cumulibacter manganitolerans TaxID=1884992 RepID=UPI001E548F44|nr:carboxyl transferase domain-containing protein [Cumulibacter manganitolerans]